MKSRQFGVAYIGRQQLRPDRTKSPLPNGQSQKGKTEKKKNHIYIKSGGVENKQRNAVDA